MPTQALPILGQHSSHRRLPYPPHPQDQDWILVTGGAGYIGSHTVVQLLDLGYHLVVVDNLCNSSEEALYRARELSSNPNSSLVFIKVDLLDAEALQRRVFDHFHFMACIHFAGLKAVGESSQIPLGYYQTNITGTLNLVQLMQQYRCRNLIFSSSATVYGLPRSDAPLTEKAPLGAMNPYGRTKLYIEQILRDTAASEPGRWNIVLLRYFNPVGAHESGRIGEDPNGIPNNLMPFVSQVAIGRHECIRVFGNDYATRDGTGVRDYIHIQDLARGHVAALKKIEAVERSGPEKVLGCVPYNLGTGRGYSVMEMIRSMSEVVGQSLPYRVVERRVGDVASVVADPTLALQELGWESEKTLEDMCHDLWRWQCQNPQGYKDAPPRSMAINTDAITPTASFEYGLMSPKSPALGPGRHLRVKVPVTMLKGRVRGAASGKDDHEDGTTTPPLSSSPPLLPTRPKTTDPHLDPYFSSHSPALLPYHSPTQSLF